MNVTQNEELIEAKTRLTNAQADMKEMQLAVLRKDYVKAVDVGKKWTDQAARVKTKLLAIPTRGAGLLSGREYEASEVETILQGLVNEALQELSGGFE